MLQTYPQYLVSHFHYFKKQEGFLFGEYDLKLLGHDTPKHFLEVLKQTIAIIKWVNTPTPLHPNPNIIGLVNCQGIEVTELYFMQRSATRLFHTKLIDKPKSHLLLIEHSLDEQWLYITLCAGQAHSPSWTAYAKAFEEGKFNERINELRGNLITIENYNQNKND